MAIALFLWLIIVTSPLNFSGAAWATNPCPIGMVIIPGGSFQIGSDDPRFEEERKATDVGVDRFCIDRTEVTNAQFAEFVAATSYVTIAERPLSKEQFSDLPEEQRSHIIGDDYLHL